MCEIWSFYHNPNTLVDFWTLALLLIRTSAIMNVVIFLINMMCCGISFKSQQLLVYYIDNINLNMLVPTGHTAL